MTDRVSSLLVVLDEDIRIDDAQHLIDAIGMMKRVIKVEPNVSDYDEYVAEERVRQDLHKKLFEMVYPTARRRK